MTSDACRPTIAASIRARSAPNCSAAFKGYIENPMSMLV
jgi:hypothetical protein